MNILNLFAKPETIAIQQAPGQLPVQILKGTEAQATPAPSIGIDNEKIIEGITKAKKVAVQLCRDGFKVLEISIGERNPVILINPSKKCAKLGGAWVRRQKGAAVTLITMAANIDGVQIEWTVPDHG